MKDLTKAVLGLIGAVILFLGIGYGVGWFGVGYTKTVGKAKQDAETEVYENSNAFTKGKRQEILKYYTEYQDAETDQDRRAIQEILSMSLADFDEDKYISDLKLRGWVKKMKY